MTLSEFEGRVARRRRITGETHSAASKALLEQLRQTRAITEAEHAEFERHGKGRAA
jgi:hypothetical protein